MIVLYKSTEKDFMHNGIGILKDCIKAEVKEVTNGNFTLELEYPLSSPLSNELVRGNIIKCPIPDERENQLFRIRRPIKNLRSVNVYAEHIAIADLGTNFIRETNIVGKSRVQALQQILENTMEKHNFIGSGDKTNTQDIFRIARYSPLKSIMGTEKNTLLSRYGGEIEFDNFNIKALEQRGKDKGVLIAYGKNITGIEETIDDNELATCIIPEGNNELLLPEYCIKSKYINSYEKIYFKHIKLDNVGVVEKSGDNGGVTIEEACNKLRQAVEHLYNVEKVDIPSCNYRVNFIELSKTEEYKDYAILEKVAIGDTVTIKHSKMNIDLKARVISYTYNALLDKYMEIELGFKKKDLTGIIQDTLKQIEFTKEKIEMGISNLDNTLSSRITITEKGIKEEINNTKEGLSNTINKTAEGLQIDIKNTKENIQGSIEATAKNLTTKFQEADGNLNAKIEQNARSIQMQVSNVRENVNSQLSIMDRKIELKVDANGVISAINMYPGRVKIDADKIDLNGYVTISSLNNGTTKIDGGCLESEIIRGVDIIGSEFRGGNIDTENLTAKGEVYFRQGVNVGDDIYARGTIGARRNLQCEGDLNVTGTKNCIQTTKNYGKLLINAYETAEVYYGDLQFGVIKDGVCVIKIDPKMLECFNTEIPYHVFTQTYNGTNLKINKYPSYIVFKGEEGTEFSYEIKAKRRGYENTRLVELVKKEGEK